MMKMLSLFFLLIMAVSIYSESCPSQEEITPCSCQEKADTGKIIVECRNDRFEFKLEDIVNPLARLVGKKNVEIELNRYDMTNVNFDIFKGIDVRSLDVTDCVIPDVTEYEPIPFEGLEDSLERLRFRGSITKKNDLSKLRLGHLRRLTDVEYPFNEIREVTDSWFHESNVERINLADSGIEKLGDRVFATANNLKELELTGNNFHVLKRSMLPSSANHLTTLYLGDMEEDLSLESGVFNNLPALNAIEFPSNGLSTLARDIWESVWEQVYYVDVEDNPIQCDQDLEWTFYLRRPDHLLGTCDGPGNMRGTNISTYIDNRGQLN